MDDKQKKAARWDALVGSGMSPDDAAAQVEQEFGKRSVPSPEQISARNADDVARSKLGNRFQQIMETFVSGHPGGLGLVAAGRGLTGENAMEAMKQGAADVSALSKDYPRSAMALKMAGAMPSTLLGGGLLKALGTVAGGAVLGGGQAAAMRLGSTDKPDESIADRLKGTAWASGIGAAAGAAMPWAMRHAITRTAIGAGTGAALAPEGHRMEGATAGGLLMARPDLTATALSKVAGKGGDLLRGVAEAVSSRAPVHEEMAGMQKLLDPVGLKVGGRAGAGQGMNQIAAQLKTLSDKAYDTARQDTRLLANKDVFNILNDPDVKQAFKAVADIRAADGKPLWKNIPDPEALHLTKRILRDIVDRGHTKESTISLANALRVQPKLDRLTALLHKQSKPWAEADRFFQKSMVGQQGLEVGFGAAKPGMRNPAATAVGERDVAGARKFAAEQPDAELQQLASGAVERGARAQMREQMAGAGLDRGRRGLLSVPILGTSGAAAEQRALALGKGAKEFEGLLATNDEAAATAKPKQGLLSGIGAYLRLRSGPGVVTVNPTEEWPMNSPEARKMIREIGSDPIAYQAALKRYMRGKALVSDLLLLSQGQAGNLAGR